ncbi:AAA family ATPase [Microvirga sp. KLBC 81]|uniref:AAA family ATPase n=1 Tax=Microvirga sp. KLBC 81 TaxID=1862707 RepID=UPI0014032E38|nr:AAA family ATPase [Microvirga sp. KLBC 81]
MNTPLPYVLLNDIHELRAKDWLIEGVIGRREIVGLVAEPFSGKSWLASYTALCVAMGWNWFGRRVQAGTVIYIAGEREAVTMSRLLAARNYHEIENVAIAVVSQSPNLDRDDDISRLLSAVREIEERLGQPTALIIFDTLARAMLRLDENSAKDASIVNHGLDRIVRETGAAILLLHHTPKGGREFRGSSAFTGALDGLLTLRASRQVRYVKLEQANDAEEGAEFEFRLKDVALEDGREAVIVDPLPPSQDQARTPGAVEAPGGASTAWPKRSGTKERPHLTPDQKVVFDALVKVAGDQNELRNQDEWRSAAIAALRAKKPRSDHALDQAFNAARKALKDLGFIKIDGTTVLIRIQSESDQNPNPRHRNQKSDQNAPLKGGVLILLMLPCELIRIGQIKPFPSTSNPTRIQRMNSQKIELFKIRERLSASGSTYFTGLLGSARVVILKDSRTPPDEHCVAVWQVFVEPKDDHISNTGQAFGTRRTKPAETRPSKGASRRSSRSKQSEARAGQLLKEHGIEPGEIKDDEVPF